jgi:hypothetical protein
MAEKKDVAAFENLQDFWKNFRLQNRIACLTAGRFLPE